MVHDFLGATRPIPWQDFCADEEEKTMTVDLYDKKKKKSGTLTFKTKFVFVELKMKLQTKRVVISHPNAASSLWKGISASMNMNNAITDGMKTMIKLKM